MISGDTKRSDALVQLAKGADVLVHEALYVPAIDALAARMPNGAALRQSILRHHLRPKMPGAWPRRPA